ncbi:MAG: hypothetical protein CMM46_09345 [Rhodospirillaceae bacterium]|nr:hypothetical protein [Rhodospirillaceae bacterium]|tara:strand:+ start:400 stop:975 length:576 start_codon:yes stop_codon:yes gene_type:complete
MPLSEPVAREHIHTREIICHAYERGDGLFDLDAHLTDVKTYGFDNRDRGHIEAGEPIHCMWLRLTINADFVIQAVEAKMDHTPYNFCTRIEPDHQKLVGAQIGAGWNRKVREHLGGTHGCTHLREMLGRMATVAFQAVYGRRRRSGEEIDSPPDQKPWVIDGCHTWSSDSPVVKMEYPDWYTGPVSEDAAK